MFSNIGWGEIFILMVAALVILGPERLPGAATWMAKSVRQARDYVSGASNQLREEFGTDLDDFRKPLSELRQLRNLSPRAAITKHLLDGDDSFLTGNFDDERKPGSSTSSGGSSRAEMNPERMPLGMDEKPPIDPDAT
ncbi:Sec-independent protein translocase subunit TatB [Hoyosella rhizosphaerae]|uniref:Sec-independent protein translocase protein TatB n=1 Tax=Hoyosella rhizosphaerae TaxID=1755582 RepID=A0A916UED3_9ACTN|nr:Sec-independent protein translocase protein TatB [Hoyosella rhizosphaerae]MBN4925593.1 Sec-independent protein translocase subunit TatB [Hoyosella rhizosphaerae]GGC69427.1 sec-independent protein translocase protein TatB [Hoyosella rhizosphaerae]